MTNKELQWEVKRLKISLRMIAKQEVLDGEGHRTAVWSRNIARTTLGLGQDFHFRGLAGEWARKG